MLSKKFKVFNFRFEYRCVLAVAVLLLALSSCTQLARTSTQLTQGLDGVKYEPTQPISWELPNGLTILYSQDAELPLVQGAVFVRGGGIWEPPDRPGIAAVLGDQMRQGGAATLNADALDRELERLAASIGTTFGAEYGKFGFSCLRSDLNQVFSLFADVVLRPRFDQDRLDLWKGQALEAVRRRTDDPGTIAGIAFNQLLYGDSPYGRVPVDKDIRAITRSELQRLHLKFVNPRDAILVVSGNVDRPTVQALADTYFGSWRTNAEDLPPPLPVTWTPKPAVYFLSFPFAQSTILMGQLGPKRLSPDYASIDMFNEVFGSSGFSARLTKRVRTELGLAYGVYGAVLAAVEKGKAIINLQTKAESSAQAIIASIEVLKGLQSKSPEAAELAEARRSITNSFVFKFDSTEEIIQRAALLRLLRYPVNYDATYVGKIDSISGADVQTTARKYWDPSKFVVVVVGNETAYNSLESALKSRPEIFPGLQLVKVRFDQKLVM